MNAPPPNSPSEPSGEACESGRPPPAVRVVGIGASAGGLTALKKLFAAVPEQPGVCFVVVVHLSAEHESHLAPLLQSVSRLPVQQVTDATPLETNRIYVIPPGVNLDAIDTHLRLSALEHDRQARAPIDHFFRTLADVQREQAVGVILTGTGSDGTQGLRRIRERGGLTIVQSPDEAEYDAMPRSAVKAGVADLVLPLDQILDHILQADPALPQITCSDDRSPQSDQADGTLRRILDQVHAATGHDFSSYKRSTVLRRIRRRMQLNHVRQLDDYLHLLQAQDQEVALLFEDLLITVTEFFRDKEVFEHLEADIIPRLFENKGSADRVRAWSVGCATGEEAYSLVMLLIEAEARREVKPKQVQVFATDIHDPALRKAREGRYPDTIEADVSPQRLSQFFDRENGAYRIHKSVRERVIFALHDVLQDPPFSHMQLISCRNVLIYLQRDVQEQLTALFHYALEENGYLLLGSAEAIDSKLFVCEDKKHGLYRRRSVPARQPRPSGAPRSPRRHAPHGEPTPPTGPPACYGVLHEQAVELYAPPSVLINPEDELVHYSARAGRFLEMSGGTPTNNIYRLLPEALRFELRASIHTAREKGGPYRSKPIRLSLDGVDRRVLLRIEPIEHDQMAGFVLVMFDELEEDATPPSGQAESPASNQARELEAELQRTNQRMQAVIEEHAASQERLQAYNEELESTNEELRSTMEELETSKEEMQSMNEELTTLNQENLQKVEELDQLSSDLHNLLTATHIATVFLDREQRILRFTPSMAELLNIRDSDRGRRLTELIHRLGYEDFSEDFKRVLDQLSPVEREIRNEQGQWHLARLLPYRAGDDRIRGEVLTFIDITERKQAEERTREAKELAEDIIDTVRNPMLVLDAQLRVRSANEAFYEDFRVQPSDIHGTLVYELNDRQWDTPRLRELLENILPRNNTIDDFEVEQHFADLGDRSLILNARRIDHLDLILLAIEDVTERKQARRALERSRDELERQVAHRTAQLQEQSARLQRLVRDLTSAEQRERKRMASVLHDSLQQLLVGVKMQLGVARDQNQEDSVARSLATAIEHLDEAIDTTRSLVRQVAPKALYEESLIPALHWLSEEMARRHNLQVTIEAEAPEPPLDDEARTLLFESVREMLFNTVKHAEVEKATVSVESEDGRIYTTVSDSGVGFDVEAKTRQRGKSEFGLFSHGDRIEAMGGVWSVDSAPGKGTRVHLSLPIHTPSDEQATDRPADEVVTPLGDAEEAADGAIRVLVVDDHTLVRSGIVTILRQDPRVTVIGEAGDGANAIAAVAELAPDVVLMDVNMPRMNGIEATGEIHRRWPEIIIIGLSMQVKDDSSARAMIDAGAATFLSKSGDAREVIETIVRLAEAKSPGKHV